MSRRLLVLALAAVVAGCSLPPAVPTATELTYLGADPPSAALDSVAAWAAESDDLGVDRSEAGLVIRDRRPGQDNVATVSARAREDGLTEVTVASVYVFSPSARDLGIAAYFGRGLARAFGLPLPGSPSCFSLDDWRAESADGSLPAPAGEAEEEAAEVSPELIGGLRGLQERLGYPPRMRRAGIAGVVLVEFVVGETGAVECAQVVSSPHPDLSEAARAAVLASAFTPGLQGGRPVSVRFVVPVSFSLR